MSVKIVVISLISSIIFGVIDAIFFLSIEEKLDNVLKKIKFLDDYSIPLIIGGLSAALSIFIASVINKILKGKVDLIENPFLDSFGIIVGTIIIIIIYYLFLRKDKKIKKRLTHLKIINNKNYDDEL